MSIPHNASHPLRRLAARADIVRSIILCALVLTISATAALADIVVNPAQPITRRVTVQLIQPGSHACSPPPPASAHPTQPAATEPAIDTLWSQAGIDINFLPNVTRYNNTFAYQGTAGTGTRPSGDLSTIFTNAATAGVLNS